MGSPYFLNPAKSLEEWGGQVALFEATGFISRYKEWISFCRLFGPITLLQWNQVPLLGQCGLDRERILDPLAWQLFAQVILRAHVSENQDVQRCVTRYPDKGDELVPKIHMNTFKLSSLAGLFSEVACHVPLAQLCQRILSPTSEPP